MKFKTLSLLALLISISGHAADPTPSPVSESRVNSTPSLEVKGAYFFFASQTMRNVYNNGGFEVSASTSIPVWKWLQVYMNLGFLEAWGKSTSLHQKTTIWEIPFDLGLKPVFKIASFAEYYFTFGPRYFFAHQHNDSSYVSKNANTTGAGIFVNTGFNFFPISHFLIDFFGEYAYEPAHFSSSKTNVYGGSVQLSKFTFGLGLGYQF